MTELLTLSSGRLTAEISPLGAELRRLADVDGREWLWDGDPAFWSGRAPLLFPVVGSVAGGVIREAGVAYPMPKHGFVRNRPLELVAQSECSVTFRLTADDETRAAYPHEFVFEIVYTLADTALIQTVTVRNPGATPLPVSFGFHPALRWPLPTGGGREDHLIRFGEAEPWPLRRIDGDGLIAPESETTPVEGRDLALADALFEADAMIWDRLDSRSLWYGAPGHPGVAVDFPDMPQLGIWTKPGAGYLCIEPWQGHADPAGHDGDFADKPGVVTIDPGSSRQFTMAMAIGAEMPE